jgi:hypothetical protein
MLYFRGVQMATNKLDTWKILIDEWEESGKTRKEFCREKNVTIANFGYWRTKINKIENPKPQGNNTFIRCKLSSSPSKGFFLEWPEGMKLRLPENIKIQEIAALVKALRDFQ